MPRILEVNDEGALYLPPELLNNIKPHTQFVLEMRGDVLILRPIAKHPPLWATLTPKELAEAIREWALSHERGPGLPDEALRRENIYE